MGFNICVVLLAAIQLAVFLNLPEEVRDILLGKAYMGAVLNWVIYGMALVLTGTAGMPGLPNLVAGILFAVYMFRHRKLMGIELKDKFIEFIEGKIKPAFIHREFCRAIVPGMADIIVTGAAPDKYKC